MKLAVTAGLLSLCFIASTESLRSTADIVGKRGGAALSHGDTKKFSEVLRPFVSKDFKFTQPGRNLDFNGLVAYMKQGISMMGHVTGAYSKVVSSTEHGNTGIVNGIHSLTASMTGQDRKVHIMVVTGTSHDTWVKIGGNWKLQHMAWGADKMTIDGKALTTK